MEKECPDLVFCKQFVAQKDVMGHRLNELVPAAGGRPHARSHKLYKALLFYLVKLNVSMPLTTRNRNFSCQQSAKKAAKCSA